MTPNHSRRRGTPDDGAVPGPGDVASLVAAFAARTRTPRLEYLPGVCPAAEPALRTAGFAAEARLPELTCRPDEAAVPAPPVNVAGRRTDRGTELPR